MWRETKISDLKEDVYISSDTPRRMHVDATMLTPKAAMLRDGDGRMNALVLGMAYIDLEAREGAEPKADSPYVRDVARIHQLEREGWHVHTVNMQVYISTTHHHHKTLLCTDNEFKWRRLSVFIRFIKSDVLFNELSARR